ncbi:DUF3796 domain-containing protein [Bacillus sp. PK3-037]|uniref:DUF3796 domain-containing protein n=1 Tax=Bacillus halotolerans TaxID=260554 RepID=A0ABY7HZK7_9BACI|nr:MULTISPECIES: DUF3796 domain-containing protein [Bacillus]QQF63662.1 hypothetical protein I9X38_05000 [Bacillus mojavensis]MBL4962912.1 hypothetical protein [Bacillus halotolerans]MBV5121824.1 hypothetical protein [Bacillus halotolerans]MCC2115984.1 DUF3796 domain-containing protein [Bacillus halotolerans]MDG0764560.1 DUF3796 domain-containing protein [Bacillus halotolerans]
MKRMELFSFLFLLIVTLYFGGTLLSYMKIEGATIGVTEWFLMISLLVAWGQFFTWRTRNEVKKDEMGKQIIKNSAHMSYNIVIITLFILWIIDFFFINNGKNYTLFIALCIAYITYPVIQFVLMKKQV